MRPGQGTAAGGETAGRPGTTVRHRPPAGVVVQVADGVGTGAEVDVVGVVGVTDVDGVVTVGEGDVVVGDGCGVVGTRAVLTPPVICWLVAIGRVGSSAR